MGSKVSKKNSVHIAIHNVQQTSSTQINTPTHMQTSPASSRSSNGTRENKTKNFSDLPRLSLNKLSPKSASSGRPTGSFHNRASSDPLSKNAPKKSLLDIMHERMHQDFLEAKEKRLKEEALRLEREAIKIAVNGNPLKIKPRSTELVDLMN